MKRLLASVMAVVCAVSLLGGCSTGDPLPKVEYLIGVSQANMREPWRLVLARELQDEAAKHPEVRLVFTDATQNTEKQINDIERLRGYGIDLLIVSPCDTQQMTQVISGVYQDIPVIVLDRVVEGYDYSLFIGPDNELIGRQAGEAVAELFQGPLLTVLELQGSRDSQASKNRSMGFQQIIAHYPGIQVQSITVENESRDAAETVIGTLGDELNGVDVIFAHNDYMALGAYNALNRSGRDDIRIVGIDGFTGPDGGLELIRQGAIDQTFTCPTGGREAIQFSLDILRKASGVPKQVILRSHSIGRDDLAQYEQAMNIVPHVPEGTIRIGYAQVGTESGWRLANNNSIRQAAKEFGIDLTAVDANQSQERQTQAVRSFVQQGVDVIVLSPIVDSGWDEVLLEAKAAGIPVLLSDRRIATKEEDLFLTFIGADFMEEGRRAMQWVAKQVPSGDTPVRILEIQGTIGATPSIDRKTGFEQILSQQPGYYLADSQSGDFTLEGGRQVVEDYLAANPWDIDVIFAHNDDMALGAIQALEAAGINPGVDVNIISVDGTRDAVQALLDGKLNCVVECSPLLGPQLMKAVTDLMSGKELPLRIITDEKVFTADNAEAELPGRSY